jgi:hypothetical protein
MKIKQKIRVKQEVSKRQTRSQTRSTSILPLVTIEKEEEDSNTEIALLDEDPGTTSENLRAKDEEEEDQNSLINTDLKATDAEIKYLLDTRNVAH